MWPHLEDVEDDLPQDPAPTNRLRVLSAAQSVADCRDDIARLERVDPVDLAHQQDIGFPPFEGVQRCRTIFGLTRRFSLTPRLIPGIM